MQIKNGIHGKTVHYWHTTAMKRHMKRNTRRTRCVLNDDVWAGNGCSYTLKTGLHKRRQYQSALSKLLLPAKLLTSCHSTSSLIQFEFKLNPTAFQWQQFVLEMRYAKMPMQDHTENCVWPIPPINTSAESLPTQHASEQVFIKKTYTRGYVYKFKRSMTNSWWIHNLCRSAHSAKCAEGFRSTVAEMRTGVP